MLKNGLIEAAAEQGREIPAEAFGSVRWRRSIKSAFYLYDYRDNLFEAPAHGTELGTGVEAVRSSAAMIFNLLGEKGFVLDGKAYSGAEYEKTFPAITDENGDTHEAHLDAVFYSADKSEMYAIEAKLLEWNDSPKNLAKAYLNDGSYLSSNQNTQTFINFFQSLIYQKQNSEGRFIHKAKRYDGIQMTLHTLALYNFFSSNEASAVKKLTLQNIVWKYDCEEYTIEEQEANRFLEVANECFVPLFESIGIDFSIQYATFQDFKERIDFSNNPRRLKYLKRYEV